MLRALTLIAMLFAAPAAFALDSGDIVVVSAKGEVRVTMGGAARDARAGLLLELPASVRTGRDGGVELRQGETTVSVGPDTLLEFPALEKRGAPIDRIQQPRGNAFYNIGKREGRKLRVETPYLVGVVKGTQFNVVAQDEATTISLFEGLLEVRATDDSAVLDLKAGEIASRRRGDKTINVVKMDGAKSPSTAPRPQGNSGGNGPGNDVPGSHDQPRAHDPLVSIDGVGVSTEIRTPVGVNADTSIEAGSGNVSVSAAVNAGADLGASVAVNAGTSGLDAAVNVAAGVGNVVDTSASAAIDLGRGAVAVDVTTSTGVDLGPVSANVDTSANVDLGSAGAAVDVAASTSVDAGPVSVAVDTSAAVDLGSAGAAVDVTASTGVDTGPVSVAVDTGAAVDLGGAGLGADLTTSTGVDAGPVTASVDTGTAVDIGGNGVAVDVDAGAALGVAQTPIDVAAGVSVGADLSAGTVDLGVMIGGLDLDLGVNLGLDGSDPASDTGSPTTDTDTATDSGDTGIIDVGGLLDGLLRRPGRR